MLEDDGRVSGNQVGTAHLLKELQEDAKGEAVEQLVLAVGEDVADLDGAALGLLESEFNTADLRRNLGVVEIKTLKLRQALPGLFNAALVHQPSRRLRYEEDNCHGDEGDHSGDRKGYAPLKGQVVLLEEAKVDPSLEKVAEGDEAAVEDDVLTTVGGGRAFGLPYGNSGTELTNTPAEDEAADDELRNLERSTLQNFADEGADSADEDDLATPKNVTDPGAGKSTEERTKGESSNDSTLLG